MAVAFAIYCKYVPRKVMVQRFEHQEAEGDASIGRGIMERRHEENGVV